MVYISHPKNPNDVSARTVQYGFPGKKQKKSVYFPTRIIPHTSSAARARHTQHDDACVYIQFDPNAWLRCITTNTSTNESNTQRCACVDANRCRFGGMGERTDDVATIFRPCRVTRKRDPRACGLRRNSNSVVVTRSADQRRRAREEKEELDTGSRSPGR